MFADAPAEMSSKLAPLKEMLEGASNAASTLGWLDRGGNADLLKALIEGSLPMEHDTFDRASSKAANHLRLMLVVAGILPPRDEEMARLERWLAEQLGGIPVLEDRQVVDAYAKWYVLRRIRQRAERNGGTTRSTASARRTILATIRFLAWLRNRATPLKGLCQADIDLWLGSGPVGRTHVRSFLSWAANHRLAPATSVPSRRSGLPASPVPAKDFHAFLRRLAFDEAIPTVERTAGLLVALYGQPVTRLVRLRIADVIREDERVFLQLGTTKLEVAPRVAQLLTALAEDRRTCVGPGVSSSAWLFPGGLPGQPMTADWLGLRLGVLGMPAGTLRTAGLLDLAAEVPAAFLAELLGMSATTAVRWVHAAGGDWTGYAASFLRGNHSSPGQGRPDAAAMTGATARFEA
ncbi:MAG: hypothetical protein ABR564_08805 [Candidatus Dormibacteria bacterium]